MVQETDPEQQSLKAEPTGHVHYVSIPIKNRERGTGLGASVVGNDYNIGSANVHYGDGLSVPQSQYQNIRRRGSILDQPIGSFKGVNSLGRFATSLQRANSFRAIEISTDRERSYVGPDGDETYDPNTLAPTYNGRKLAFICNYRSRHSICQTFYSRSLWLNVKKR